MYAHINNYFDLIVSITEAFLTYERLGLSHCRCVILDHKLQIFHVMFYAKMVCFELVLLNFVKGNFKYTNLQIFLAFTCGAFWEKSMNLEESVVFEASYPIHIP